MRIQAISDISSRQENQDNYWACRLEIENKEHGIVCVCDGMGGLDDGKRTSARVVEELRKVITESGSTEGIVGAIQEVNDKVYQEHLGKRKSGTTCVLVISDGESYTMYNVGDSRCYMFSERGVIRLSEDHTVLEKMRKNGEEITEEKYKKYKNVLTRCIGASSKTVVDTLTGKCGKGDSFLVCSDGFWHTLKADDFISGRVRNLQEMVTRCKELGENDNITACMLDI